MLIAHKLDLNAHLVGLRFSLGFAPLGRLHLSVLSRSRAPIKVLFGFIGSNQPERDTPWSPLWSPCCQGTPLVLGAAAGAQAAYFCAVTHSQQQRRCTEAASTQQEVPWACQVPTPRVPSWVGGSREVTSSGL